MRVANPYAEGPAQTRQSAQVLWLDRLVVPGQLDELECADAARRLRTLLLIAGDESHAGGTGKALKTFNCFGEPVCLKSLRPVSHIGHTREERSRIYGARVEAFSSEFVCQRELLGIPGIPAVYGYGTFAGGPVMLMEWVQGYTLRNALLPRATRLLQGLSIRLLSALGATVAGILCAARTRDPHFVHRDLSGMNVLISISRTPLEQQVASCLFDLRIIDFGCAMCQEVVRARQAARPDAPRVWRNATPEYAPPEMLTHHDPALVPLRSSETIDSYSLCSMLYELYCGETPYRLSTNSPLKPYLFKLGNRPPTPRLRRPTDEPFVGLLMEGLQQEQNRRPSLSELRCRMLQICGDADADLASELQRRYEVARQRAQTPSPKGSTDLSLDDSP